MRRISWLYCVVMVALMAQLFTPSLPAIAQTTPVSPQSAPLMATGDLQLSFRLLRTIGETGKPYPTDPFQSGLFGPAGIVVDGSNNVYAVEQPGKRLWAWQPGTTGTTLSNFPYGDAGQVTAFGNPQDVVLHDSALWVADWYEIVVVKSDGSGDQHIYSYNTGGGGTDYLECVQGITFDGSNHLFVTQSCGRQNVLMLTVSVDSESHYVLTLQKTIGQGNFNNPQQLAYVALTSDTARLYVTDNSGIVRCTEDSGTHDWACNQFIGGFQGRGLGVNPSNLDYLYAVRNDESGTGVYRCNSGGCSAYLFNPAEGERIMADPVDVAFDTSGTMFITDRGDSTVKKCSAPSTCAIFAGNLGVPYATAPGYYNDPAGIAIASDGDLLIQERSGTRLIKVDPSGSNIDWQFGFEGKYGDDQAHLNWPQGNPAVDTQGRIYVPDRNNNRVVVLSADGAYLTSIAHQNGTTHYDLPTPSAVAIGPNSDIYVASQDAQSVTVFTSDRLYQSIIGTQFSYGSDAQHFNYPSGLAVLDDQTVFVSDMNNQRIQKCTRASATATTWTCTTFLGAYGDTSNDLAHLNRPASLALDRSLGRLYIADQNNNRIQVFTTGGKFLATIGGDRGQAGFQFNNPFALAVVPGGNLYVADTDNHRIQVFAPVISDLTFAGQIGGPQRVMAINPLDSSHLYVNEGARLDVFSTSAPASPALVGVSDLLPQTINGLAVDGNTAFATLENNGGLAVIDVTNKAHPVQVAHFPFTNATSVAVKGRYAYVTARCCTLGLPSGALMVFDMADPAIPRYLRAYVWPGHAIPNVQKVVLSSDGDTAYIAAHDKGVIKVTGLTSLTETRTLIEDEGTIYNPGGDITDIALSSSPAETYAYLADQSFGLRVITTADMQSNGHDVNTTTIPGDSWTPSGIQRNGTDLWLSAGGAGLGWVSINNPAAPTLVAHQVYMGEIDQALGLGSYVYLARAGLGLAAFTPTGTALPNDDDGDTSNDLLPLTQHRPVGVGGKIRTLGNYTYEAGWVGGLRILDTSDPTNPRELSASLLDTSVNDVDVLQIDANTTYAYVISGYPGRAGLTVLDVSDPTNPKTPAGVQAGKGFTDIPYLVSAIAVRKVGADIYAYIAKSNWYGPEDGKALDFYPGWLHIYKVTDLNNISELTSTSPEIDGNANRILLTASGKYAIVNLGPVCDYNGANCRGFGFRVYDVSNPESVVQVKQDTSFASDDMQILGDRLYLAGRGDGLIIWDISNADASQWSEWARYRTDRSNINSVAVENKGGLLYAYVSDSGANNLQVLDVTHPEFGVEMISQSAPLAGFPYEINRVGKYILLTSYNAGLYTFWATPSKQGWIQVDSGGTMDSLLDKVTYSFATGDVSQGTWLLHTPILPADAPAPGGTRAFAGRVFANYAWNGDDDTLAEMANGQAYDLTIIISAAELGSIDPGTLGLYSFNWSTMGWVQAPAQVYGPTTGNYILTAHPTFFGLWSVQGYGSKVLPSGSITAGTSNFTASHTVNLSLTATSPQSTVTSMRFSNDNTSWTMWEAFALTKLGWKLSDGDGLKTVYAQFKDLTGNVSQTVSDSISVFTSPPTASAFTINGGNARTSNASVTLDITLADASHPAESMLVANDAGFTGATWQPFAATLAWTLSEGRGSKTVYVKLRDGAGNVSSVYSASIIYGSYIYLPVTIKK